MGGVDFGVGQRAVGAAISEGIRQALLSGRDVLAAIKVEEFNLLEERRPGLPNGGQYGVVRHRVGHHQGQVAPDGRVGRQGFELAGGDAATQEFVEVEFGEEDAAAKVVLAGESGVWSISPGCLPARSSSETRG